MQVGLHAGGDNRHAGEQTRASGGIDMPIGRYKMQKGLLQLFGKRSRYS